MAVQISEREKQSFLKQRRARLLEVFDHNRKLISGIPQTVASESIKSNFLKMRKNLMIRTIQAEIQMKKMVEWTLPKLIELAKKEQRDKRAADKEKERIIGDKM